MKINILFFIRLLLGHIWLLILIPICLGTLVYVLTEDQPKTYDTKGTIFTAFATGSTIELSATKFDYSKTNIRYENLINLIRSRAIIEVVSLKLLAQHLSIEGPDVLIIGDRKYMELMEEIPPEIKELVVPGDIKATYEAFEKFRKATNDNYLNELLTSGEHDDYTYENMLRQNHGAKKNRK